MRWYAEPSRQHRNCCGVLRCGERGCRIALPPPPRLVLNGDKLQDHGRPGKLCDCLVFWTHSSKGPAVVILELKSGSIPVNKAADQLQAGATLVESLLAGCEPAFAPVLVKRRGLHPLDTKVLGQRRIRFQHRDYPIRTVSCGASVVELPA